MKTRQGRTLEAVLKPKRFKPFPGIGDSTTFESAWREKPMWILANMAHAAYHEEEALRPWFDSFNAKLTVYKSTSDTRGITRGRQAILASWPDRAILAFRGTDATTPLKIRMPDLLQRMSLNLFGKALPEDITTFLATDILDDIRLQKVRLGESEVHKGFHEATMELWPEISRDIDALALPDPQQVHVTGHSLGGAMSVIAGMHRSFQQIVTFGEPRVGRHVGKSLKSTHIRYVNGEDPVTRVMPTMFPFSYEHHGERRDIVDMDHGGPHWIHDHSIVNYAEVLA